MITKKDLEFVAEVKQHPSQRELFHSYVKDAKNFTLKERRQLMGHIQKERSMVAREIFLKELASLGKKLSGQPGTQKEKVAKGLLT